MGIKSLSLQMIIPWCFHMGGQVSCVHQMGDGAAERRRRRSIKVIQSDGVVKVYHRPINASDLMVEFPKHLVCRSDSFTIGQKIPALSEHEKLQLGHNYFLLPNHLFQSVLSFVTIASFANTNALLHKRASTSCQPFIIRKAPSGSLQIRVSDEFISKLILQSSSSSSDNKDSTTTHDSVSKGNNKNKLALCTTAHLEKEYSALVESRQCWKPKLETIRESKRRRSLGSFGIKRSKGKKAHHQSTSKTTTTTTTTTTHHQQHQIESGSSSATPSSSKTVVVSSSSSSSKNTSKSTNTSRGSSSVAAKKKGKKI